MALIKDKILVIEDEKSISYLFGDGAHSQWLRCDQGLYRDRGL